LWTGALFLTTGRVDCQISTIDSRLDVHLSEMGGHRGVEYDALVSVFWFLRGKEWGGNGFRFTLKCDDIHTYCEK
jgi:hypothetical protein